MGPAARARRKSGEARATRNPTSLAGLPTYSVIHRTGYSRGVTTFGICETSDEIGEGRPVIENGGKEKKEEAALRSWPAAPAAPAAALKTLRSRPARATASDPAARRSTS